MSDVESPLHNNKKILYIGGFELPDKNAAAHRVISNAKLFRKLGYNTIFVGINKEMDTNDNIMQTKQTIFGFDVYSIKYPKKIGEWFKYISNIENYTQIINMTENLHAVVCYNFQSIALERIRVYCKKKGILCIADVTEWYTGSGRSIPMRLIKGLDTFYRMRIIQKKMDGLIVISKYLENYYRLCKHVIYIPPLTDLSELKWNNNYEKSKEVLYLVYAGSPGMKDRIDLLIEATKSINRKIIVDIVGINKQEYLTRHPEHIEYLNKSNNIFFHGRVSHEKAIEFVKKANYSCFFRYKDRVTMAGFPTKFAEAISCGTPVITSDTSDLKDYVGEMNGLLLSKLTCSDIVDAIENAPFEMSLNRYLLDLNNYKSKIEQLF